MASISSESRTISNADSPVHHEARDQGGFGVKVSCRDRHLSLELWGVCDPPS